MLSGCAAPATPGRGPLVNNLFFGETADPRKAGQALLTGIPDYADFGKGFVAAMLGIVDLGITDSFGLRTAVPYLLADDGTKEARGFGDIAVGAHYGFPLDENWRFGVTLDVGLGNAEPPFPVGEVLVRPGALASARFGNFELHAGFAGLFTESDTGAQGFGALVYGTGPWRALIEASGVSDSFDFDIARLTPGLGLHTDWFEVLVGVPIGLTSDSRDWGVTAAFSTTF